jgi:hypothetical protein
MNLPIFWKKSINNISNNKKIENTYNNFIHEIYEQINALDKKHPYKHGKTPYRITWKDYAINSWKESCKQYLDKITYIFKKYSSISSCETNMSKYSQCEYNKAKYYNLLKNGVYEASVSYYGYFFIKDELSALIDKYNDIYNSKKNEHLKKMQEHCGEKSEETKEKICNINLNKSTDKKNEENTSLPHRIGGKKIITKKTTIKKDTKKPTKKSVKK